ncbi:YciI family protein [Luteimonas kalidii]|uniref:YciI family protein n=1 Tax=Luteimonas kalidii TaxID=3042025 RepID=A0ABT6JT46_9GAMM|nr:YciI family protein [Luteimonas kalidii]MDH5833311.1 YciI family protein [Luteimonas kalidii]
MTDTDGSQDFLVLSRGQWRREASPDEIQAAIDAFYTWIEDHIAAGRMKTGERLARAGATVSAKGVTVDGPFGETKELVGGYWFAVAPSLEDAAALLATSPTLACGLFYEVRPLELERATARTRSNETPD